MADLYREAVGNLGMSGNWSLGLVGRINENRVTASFAIEAAAVALEMVN
jgi:hypothetical protein